MHVFLRFGSRLGLIKAFGIADMQTSQFNHWRGIYEPWCRTISCSAFVLVLLSAAGCATNPVTGRWESQLVSEAREIQLGEASYLQAQQSQGGAYVTHPAVVDYVRSVGEKLVRVSDRKRLPYDIVVLNNAVPNAWALPGGKMAVNRGLLIEMESEAELAAVLGHEIVHVAARHGAKSIERGLFLQAGMMGLGIAVGDEDYQDIIIGATGLGATLLTMKYGRGHELEADKYGIEYMSKAGYDPEAAVKMQETFLRLSDAKDPNWITGLLVTHPPSRERIRANRKTLENYPKGGFVGRQEYRQAIKPLLDSKEAYAIMADGYKALAEGNTALAGRLADKAIGIEPDEAHFHALAAKVHAAEKNWKQTANSLNRAIALNDSYYEYYLLRGRLAHAKGRRADAKRDLRKSLALLPTASGHYLLGSMSLDEGNERDAIANFRIAARSNASDGEKARAMLARLEIDDQPQKYLRVSTSLDRGGYLRIAVQNTTSVDVARGTISVSSASGRQWRQYAIPNGLPAGRQKTVQTREGPFPDIRTANAQTRIRFENIAVRNGGRRR